MEFINDEWKENFFKEYFNEDSTEKLIKKCINDKNEHLKKPLYQYTKVKYAENLINDNLMFMRNLDGLNDPLEGDLKCDFKKTIQIKLDEELYKNFSDEQKELIKLDFKKVEIEKYKNMWEKVKKYVSIACFSENYDINPMWAHYADNHEGICVEYDFYENELLKNLCFPVYYVNNADNEKICVKILKEFKAKNRLISQLFLKKGKNWKYENEWRIIISNNLNHTLLNFKWKNRKRYLKFPKPKSVYLGYRINKDDEKYLKAMCRDYGIKIYKIIKDDTGYNLKSKPI